MADWSLNPDVSCIQSRDRVHRLGCRRSPDLDGMSIQYSKSVLMHQELRSNVVRKTIVETYDDIDGTPVDPSWLTFSG